MFEIFVDKPRLPAKTINTKFAIVAKVVFGGQLSRNNLGKLSKFDLFSVALQISYLFRIFTYKIFFLYSVH